jgi:alpha-L-fucosidase
MDENEEVLPDTVVFKDLPMEKIRKATILGANGRVKWQKNGDNTVFTIPSSAKTSLKGTVAFTIKLK